MGEKRNTIAEIIEKNKIKEALEAQKAAEAKAE
jgi:hypothetical protein